MAGQMIVQGFTGFRIPISVRRLVTIVLALVVVGTGVNTTQALVVSQVIPSFALPIPMIALVVFTRRQDIMGEFANARPRRTKRVVVCQDERGRSKLERVAHDFARMHLNSIDSSNPDRAIGQETVVTIEKDDAEGFTLQVSHTC